MSDCQCTAPGYCPRHDRYMPEAFWKLCHESQAYFEVFQLDRGNHRPQGCIHRGPQIDEGTATLCGRNGERFPIYSCDLHGECVIGAFCRRQKWRSCLTCGDQTSADVVSSETA